MTYHVKSLEGYFLRARERQTDPINPFHAPFLRVKIAAYPGLSSLSESSMDPGKRIRYPDYVPVPSGLLYGPTGEAVWSTEGYLSPRLPCETALTAVHFDLLRPDIEDYKVKGYIDRDQRIEFCFHNFYELACSTEKVQFHSDGELPRGLA